MKVLFGGSFNPVHNGHLILARDVLEDFGFSEVLFVPANVQPLKGKLLIPPKVRLRALEKAVEGERGFSVWRYELEKGGISYTYETLKAFRKTFGEEPVFMMGADSFLSFNSWRNPKGILELSRLLIVSRPGFEVNPEEVLKGMGINLKVERFKRGKGEIGDWRVAVYEGRLLEISSTEIRERIKSGKSIKYFVPEAVEEEIRRWWRNGLQKDV